MTSNEDQPLLAYITTPDAGQALQWGKILVEEKLAGCVNILPAMVSVYVWEGRLETSQESVLLAKTFDRHREALKERIMALHSYQIPCILFLPISDGHLPYLNWLRQGIKA